MNAITHFRLKYHCKGEVLRAVKDFLYTALLTPHSPDTIEQPPYSSSPIPQLTLVSGFACNVDGCGRQQSEWLSQNRRIVEKHVQKQYIISNARSRAGQRFRYQNPQQIKPVIFQSIFARPYYRPFIVQIEHMQNEHMQSEGNSSKTAYNINNYPACDFLFYSYIASCAELKAQTQSINVNTHKSQLPLWLKNTGIARWLADINKNTVKQLRANWLVDEDLDTHCIHNAVYEALKSINKQVRLGDRQNCLNRSAA